VTEIFNNFFVNVAKDIGDKNIKDRLNGWVVLRVTQIDWLIMRDVIGYVPVFIYNMIFRNDRRVILNWTFCRKWILTILSQILFRTLKHLIYYWFWVALLKVEYCRKWDCYFFFILETLFKLSGSKPLKNKTKQKTKNWPVKCALKNWTVYW
jgi:hypothetical protein